MAAERIHNEYALGWFVYSLVFLHENPLRKSNPARSSTDDLKSIVYQLCHVDDLHNNPHTLDPHETSIFKNLVASALHTQALRTDER